jgi:poly(3-hydroxybutyrate) depolymerase
MLKSELCIDTTRIFAEGFSMGGSMSYALACEAPDMFRAVAVHSGGPMSGCNKKNKPVAYFMTHGTQDATCTYPGYGVPQINEFAKLNGCQAMDIPNTLKPTDQSGMNPACADFTGCSDGHPTRACIFVGPHTPSPGGNKTWVPAETWKFISKF